MEGKLMAAIYEHAKRQVLVNGSDVISSECDNLCQLLKMAQVLALTGEKEYAIQYLRGAMVGSLGLMVRLGIFEQDGIDAVHKALNEDIEYLIQGPKEEKEETCSE